MSNSGDAEREMAGPVVCTGPRGIELSVIIVNWNSKEFLRKCLVSLFSNGWDCSWEVVVIDNASYDGSGEMVSADFPNVRFLQGTANLGFASANNAAFSQSHGEHILFLNPDTVIIGTAVRSLLAFLKATPDAGAVGGRLLNTDLTVQLSCIKRFPGILNQAFECDVLIQTFPRASLWGMALLFDSDTRGGEVDVISGACLMLRREAFEQVGCFSSCYFMYSEDVDLCYKLRLSGRKNYYLASATVIHHGGKSTSRKEAGFSAVVMHEARKRFFDRHRGAIYAACYQLSTCVVAVSRVLVIALVCGVSPRGPRRTDLFAAFLRWFKVLRWSVGLERWASQLQDRCRLSEPDRPLSSGSTGPTVADRVSPEEFDLTR